MLWKVVFLSLILPSLSFAADNIQRSEGHDGIIEFSNISPKQHKTTKQTIIYKYPASDDIPTFTNQKPQHIASFEVLRFDCYACHPDSTVDWYKVKLNLTAYSAPVDQAAKKHQVDPALLRALIHAESAFNANALSHQGAQGLMQLMPETANELGVQNALDPKQNILGGAQYIAQLLKQFKGDIKLATAAYNAGPNAVKKYSGIPPYKETEVYVERVGILLQRYQEVL